MDTPIKSTDAERIIEVAERIFLERGFQRVLMDDLAAELGMSKKTLYLPFESKEALLRAVLIRRTERAEESLREIVSRPDSFPVKMRNLVHFVHQTIAKASPVLLDDIRRYAPQCFSIVEEFRGRAIPLYFGRVLDEGITAGYLRKDIRRELLIRMLVLAVQGIVRPDVLDEWRIHPSEVLDGILSILLKGALTPEGRRLRNLV